MLSKSSLLIAGLMLFVPNLFSQSGTWTWVGGSNLPDQPGNFTTQGVPGGASPQALYGPACWIDLEGNFWIFGGLFGGQESNDLFRYNPTSNEWTWMKGPGQYGDPGNYGTQRVAAMTNNPAARAYGSAAWTDKNGDLWLFGGQSNNQRINDLWRYQISTNEWTWMNGSNLYDQPDNYGTLGVASPTTSLGARQECVASWVDAANNLWFFGGLNTIGCYNDMWRYNIGTNQWTWMSGPQGAENPGSYGTMGVEAPGNLPPPRAAYTRWQDNAGNFYLYGGENFNTNANYGDVWKYNTNNNYWTWIAGSATPDMPGTYLQYCANTSTGPGARSECRTPQSVGCTRNFFAFGGLLDNLQSNNDLWIFDISNAQWKWLSGSSSYNAQGYYGTQGVASSGNAPPARAGCATWQDGNGNFWLFGGWNSNSQYYNDLWKFTPDTLCVGPVLPTQIILGPPPPPMCGGDSAIINLNAATQPQIAPSAAVTWLSSAQVSVKPDSTTKFIVVGQTACGSDTEGFTLVVLPHDKLILHDSIPTVCMGDSSLLTITNAYDIDITPATGINWISTNTAWIAAQNTTTFTITGQTNCGADTETFTFNVLPAVIAAFAANPLYVNMAEPVVSVNNQSANYASLYWYVDSTLIALAPDNKLQFTDTGVHCILAIADNSKGCADTAEHCVTVLPTSPLTIPSLYVPEAFTPNNDGVNDYFTIFGKNLIALNVEIFNRWGEKVYSTNNLGILNNPGDGWDGKYKSKLQDPGTFVYYINATGNDGNKIEKKGSVILIR